jgi:hypothetical protein
MLYREGLEIRARNSFQRSAVELYFLKRMSDGRLFYLQNPPLEIEVDKGKELDNVLSIDEVAAQALMDSLWECGLRPTEGTGSAGSLKATQNHLGDMQKLSWKLLEMVEKEK